MVAVALVLLGSIPRGTGLPCRIVREGPTGDHQPLLGARAFALEPCLYPAPDQRNRHRPFLAVSYRQVRPRIARECLAPLRHRLPRSLEGKPRHDLLYASASFRRLDCSQSKPALSTGHQWLKMLSCTTPCSVLGYTDNSMIPKGL